MLWSGATERENGKRRAIKELGVTLFERGSQYELFCENTGTFMRVSSVPEKIITRHGLVQKKCRDNTRRYRDVLIRRKDYKLSELDNLFNTELCNSRRRNMK